MLQEGRIEEVQEELVRLGLGACCTPEYMTKLVRPVTLPTLISLRLTLNLHLMLKSQHHAVWHYCNPAAFGLCPAVPCVQCKCTSSQTWVHQVSQPAPGVSACLQFKSIYPILLHFVRFSNAGCYVQATSSDAGARIRVYEEQAKSFEDEAEQCELHGDMAEAAQKWKLACAMQKAIGKLHEHINGNALTLLDQRKLPLHIEAGVPSNCKLWVGLPCSLRHGCMSRSPVVLSDLACLF